MSKICPKYSPIFGQFAPDINVASKKTATREGSGHLANSKLPAFLSRQSLERSASPYAPQRSGLSFLRTKVEVLTGRTVVPDIHKRTGKATVPRPRAVEPAIAARISFQLAHALNSTKMSVVVLATSRWSQFTSFSMRTGYGRSSRCWRIQRRISSAVILPELRSMA